MDGTGVLEDYAGGQQAGAGGAGSGASESDDPFKRLWKRNFEHRKTVNSKKRLTTEDVNRIKAQDEGGMDWRTVDQQAIEDCFLLAALQAYSQSEDGRQLLRDNIRLNDARDGFIVTLYDNGQPVDVNVTDYYTNGLQGQQTAPPTLLNIYERAYGLYFGGQNLARGGESKTAMERISSRGPDRIDTRGGTGATFWPWWDDDTYSDSEWRQIEQAIHDDRPVVASSPEGGASSVTIASTPTPTTTAPSTRAAAPAPRTREVAIKSSATMCTRSRALTTSTSP